MWGGGGGGSGGGGKEREEGGREGNVHPNNYDIGLMCFIQSRGIPSEASPYCLTTPPSGSCQTAAAQSADITTTSSIDQTREWLLTNRFSQYLSLFVNYSGMDLLRLSRRDLVDLCGTADGIRLYNALRTQTVRVLYVTFGQEKGWCGGG